jgi:acetyl esterase
MPVHRSEHPELSPAMRGLLARMHRSGLPAYYTLSPEQARQAYADGANVLELPSLALPRVENFTLVARDGYALPVRLYVSGHTSDHACDQASGHALGQTLSPVLVYFHGGGFTIGSLDTHDILCRRLSHLTGAAVLSVEYRLAPQWKFPTAVNDAWDALQWVAHAGASQQLDPQRIAVGGDSAGGTLAAVCAILARDAGIALALQMLIYPGTAGHANTPSHQKYAHGLVLEKPHLVYFFTHYLNTPSERNDWRFAPLDGLCQDGQVADVSNLAPAWIGLAECDPLVDEGIAYADRLRMAGVAVDLEIYRGVVHEFIKMGRSIVQAGQAQADAARALRMAWGMS